MVSELFDPAAWQPVAGFDFTDITYHRAVAHGTVRIAFDRPEIRNAFRPQTVDELYRTLDHARQTPDVGCVLLTGNGPSPRDGGWAFCSGGDQRIRGKDGYRYAEGETAETIDPGRSGRLHILEVQRLIRFMPKVVICVVPGWAAGGGHSLHVVADLTIASREHARFKQTDADVASFDGGFGSAYLARQVGQKFAREIFFLGQEYSADEGREMGVVNKVVAHADLERTALEWGALINGKSPTAQRMLKFAFNLVDDGLIGQQVFAGEATRLAYMTAEAARGRRWTHPFLEKRPPDWSPFPWHYRGPSLLLSLPEPSPHALSTLRAGGSAWSSYGCCWPSGSCTSSSTTSRSTPCSPWRPVAPLPRSSPCGLPPRPTWPALPMAAAIGQPRVSLLRPQLRAAYERRHPHSPAARGVHGGIVGQEAITLDSVGDEHAPGHVRLIGERWLAVTDTGSVAPIPEGTRVFITAVRGTTLVVLPVSALQPPRPPLPPSSGRPDA